MSIITHTPEKVKSQPSPLLPKFLRSHLTRVTGSSFPFTFLLVSYLYVFLMPTSTESEWHRVGSQTTRNLRRSSDRTCPVMLVADTNASIHLREHAQWRWHYRCSSPNGLSSSGDSLWSNTCAGSLYLYSNISCPPQCKPSGIFLYGKIPYIIVKEVLHAPWFTLGNLVSFHGRCSNIGPAPFLDFVYFFKGRT